MPQNNTRFVVHMDILGMSELVAKDAELAWRVLGNLVDARNHVNNYEVTFLDMEHEVPIYFNPKLEPSFPRRWE